MKTPPRSAAHEDLSRGEELRLPSDRWFGTVFAVVFLGIGLLPVWAGRPARAWAVAVSVSLLMVTLAAPSLLTPLNRLWMRFGLLLHRLFSPILLGLIFFGMFTPLAWLLRMRQQDLLGLRFDAAADTYWIARDPPGPAPKSMAHQF